MFKIASEDIRLVVLNLTVLHWSASQELVQLNGVNGRSALFVLSGPGADPVVDVVAREAAHLLRLGKKKKHGSGKTRPPSNTWKGKKAPRTTTVQCSSSQTYRQKYVAVTLVKVSVPLLGHLHQIHFLLHRGEGVYYISTKNHRFYLLWSRRFFFPP